MPARSGRLECRAPLDHRIDGGIRDLTNSAADALLAIWNIENVIAFCMWPTLTGWPSASKRRDHVGKGGEPRAVAVVDRHVFVHHMQHEIASAPARIVIVPMSKASFV